MVQGAGFEPAKHYAQRPERCPFDRSGTPAWKNGGLSPVFQNGEYCGDAAGSSGLVVQGVGFEPTKHYALGPKPSPFDHSGTPA